MKEAEQELVKKTLKTCRFSRTLLRNKVKKRIEFATNLNMSHPEFPDGEDPQAIVLFVNEVMAKIREWDERIVDLVSEDERENELSTNADFYLEITEALSKISTAILRVSPPEMTTLTPMGPRRVHFGSILASTPVRSGPVTHETQQVPAAPTSTVVRSHRELDISPEPFNGDRLKFKAFMTQFRCFVNKRPESTPMERLMILRKYLRDEPKQIVEALELTDANYDIALSLLESNYSRIETETKRILSELRNLPRITKPYDHSGLRKFLTTIQSNIAVLAANGIPLATHAFTLKSSIEAAMPPRMRQEFWDDLRLEKRFQTKEEAPSQSGSVPTEDAAADSIKLAVTEVEKMLAFLQRRVQDLEDSKYLENAIGPSESKSTEDRKKFTKDRSRELPSTVAAAAAHASPTDAKAKFKPRPCLFCETTDHRSSRCSADFSLQKRTEILRSRKRCPKCFRPEHSSPNECKGPRFPCATCKSPDHYPSMHKDDKATTSAVVDVVSCGAETGDDSLLWTASAFVISGETKIPIRAFIDPGSSVTFMLPSLRQRIRENPIRARNLNLQAFANNHRLRDAPVFSLRLAAPLNEAEVVELQAIEYDFGVDPPNRQSSDASEAIKKFNKLHPVADRSYLGEWVEAPPAILIGMDQMGKILLRSPLPETVVEDVLAHPSRFGWVIGGPIPLTEHRDEDTRQAAPIFCCAATVGKSSLPSAPPAEVLQRLWNLEAVGIAEPPPNSQLSADEDSAVQQFNEGLVFDGSRYVVTFPKKPSIGQLQNNKPVALRRLDQKLRQLARDPARYRRYHEEIMKFVRDGHAAEVQVVDEVTSNSTDGSYYMPHHEVTSAVGTDEKWRIVFDCSSSEKGATSLNDNLLAGPNLNPQLVAVLLNFRVNPVAVSADITKAYLQLAIRDADRSLFKFVWRAPGERHVKVFQMEKVIWGAASSGFLLAATLREHFKRTQPPCSELGASLYADDFLLSFIDEQQATDFTDRIRKVLADAGMSLAKWKTNSVNVTQHLINTGVDPTGLDSSENDVLKVLGLSWSPKEDSFRFTVSGLGDRFREAPGLTKRAVLGLVASVYDPLGWMMPYLIRGKIIVQKMWEKTLEWNQPVNDEIRSELSQWVAEAKEFERFSFPRQYGRSGREPSGYRLHVFGDASKKAYACAAYVEAQYSGSESAFSLLMSKSRLAPRDQVSLPRLELLAALIAVRLKEFLFQQMRIKFDSVRFYTDSMIAYHWATSSRPGNWKTYVSNRVSEIQAGSKREEWFHVEGKSNISDLATRGISAEALIKATEWWVAPSWLRMPSDRQPISQPAVGQSTFEDVRSEIRVVAAPIVATHPLIDLNRYSSIGSAKRVLVTVLRFVLRTRKIPIPKNSILHRTAENIIIRHTQRQYFRQEINATLAKDRVANSSKLGSFNLEIDEEGLLRAKTRLTEGPFFTHDEKNPIVIPGDSRLATLLIVDAHRVNGHFGVSTVLSQLRRRFWLTRGRQVIKAILHRCVTCRKKQARPAEQLEAPLPQSRADLTAPFRTTGVDFCGPFHVRNRQSTTKTYVAVFTCTAIRAVHLELLPTQSTPQTLLAIRRFLASYPACTQFISDNGASFVKAATDIKGLFNSLNKPEVREFLAGRVIGWDFICPRSPWHGGFYERAVGLLKSALIKTLGRSLLGFEEFRTILCELSAVINDRPLTHVSTDVEAPTAITPAQFLRGGPSYPAHAAQIPVDQLRGDEIATPNDLRRGLARRTTYFKNLSVRWFREYLALLRSANTTRGRQSPGIQVGDVCVLREDNVARVKWPLVRVEEAHPGRDGLTRVYSVKFSNGRVSRRAAQLLYPLELDVATTEHHQPASEPDRP